MRCEATSGDAWRRLEPPTHLPLLPPAACLRVPASKPGPPLVARPAPYPGSHLARRPFHVLSTNHILAIFNDPKRAGSKLALIDPSGARMPTHAAAPAAPPLALLLSLLPLLLPAAAHL